MPPPAAVAFPPTPVPAATNPSFILIASLLLLSTTTKAAGVNQLFVIGGDGTMRGASLIANEVKRRGLRIAVAGEDGDDDDDNGYP
jgi:hypothetical protein